MDEFDGVRPRDASGMRRPWLIGLAALAALALLDTLAWRVATAQLSTGADRWIADARRQGWVVTEQERVRGGWPFAAELAIAGPQVAGGDAMLPGGLRWSAQRLVLAVSVFHPTRLALAALGQQRLRLSGLPDLAFTGARLAASLKLWGSASALAQIDAEAVSGGIAGSRHPDDVQVASLQLRVSAVGEPLTGGAWPSATLAIHAAGIGLPDTGQWPLGALVAELGGTLALHSPSAGPTGPSDLENQARAWRDGGGRLDAHALKLRWGRLGLAADAALTLDRRLQPAGSGNADLSGSQATLAALSGAGVITPGLAATAGAMLAFMPRAPGDASAVRLAFRLRDDIVSVGEIPVFQVKDIRWK